MTLRAQALPKVGLVMESVKVIRWLKAVGDSVTQGENLLEVETEKSIVEIEAGVSGRLAQILVQADEEASVGDQIAWIESADVAADRRVQTESAAAPMRAPADTGAIGATHGAREADRDTARALAGAFAAARPHANSPLLTGSSSRASSARDLQVECRWRTYKPRSVVRPPLSRLPRRAARCSRRCGGRWRAR
jgi:pyruvate/2-oxoglutarate dehydrogenase complex dihydrolipoamide acyltransferase (E2) component